MGPTTEILLGKFSLTCPSFLCVQGSSVKRFWVFYECCFIFWEREILRVFFPVCKLVKRMSHRGGNMLQLETPALFFDVVQPGNNNNNNLLAVIIVHCRTNTSFLALSLSLSCRLLNYFLLHTHTHTHTLSLSISLLFPFFLSFSHILSIYVFLSLFVHLTLKRKKCFPSFLSARNGFV